MDTLQAKKGTTVKTYNETRVNLSGIVKTKFDDATKTEKPLLNEDGSPQTEDQTNMTEKKANEILEFHKKNNLPEPTISKMQTFQYTEPEDISEVEPYLTSLGLDPAVAKQRAVDIFQRGWASFQQAEVRAFMADAEAVEGVYSVAADAAQPAERRVKDPLSVAANALKKAGFNLSLDDLKSLMANFQAPAETVTQ